MSGADAEQIEQLLREGLDLYAEDEVSAAIVTWNRVLELDPGNERALDYVSNADRRSTPAPPAPPAADGGVPEDAGSSATELLLREARLLMGDSQWGAALELLQSACHREGHGLEVEAMIDLARTRLFLEHREAIGALASVPRLRSDAGPITRYNLPTDAGFLLSMVDGMTSVEDLVSLSGMDAFDTLHSLRGLMDAGLVEMGA